MLKIEKLCRHMVLAPGNSFKPMVYLRNIIVVGFYFFGLCLFGFYDYLLYHTPFMSPVLCVSIPGFCYVRKCWYILRAHLKKKN